MALDAARNRNFNTRYPEDALVLIENLASSNSTKNADFERKKLGSNMDGSQIAEVKAKIDSVHNLLVGKKTVQFAQEVETFIPEEEQDEKDCNYVGGAGFQGQRFGGQQGYQRNEFQKPFQSNNYQRNYGSSSYQTPPAQSSESSEMKSMLEQLLEGQQKMTVSFNGKMDAMYSDLNGKIEAINIHMKKLDTQVAQTAENVRRQEGFLPAKTETNPRLHVNAITVGSEKELFQACEKGLEEEEFVELEEISNLEITGST
ncbi:hypothetical protein KYD79_26615, partial [Escherichia coli]|nr:hypothetical protein [Escherichia coli]